jgi:GcrA cell cycle regulator
MRVEMDAVVIAAAPHGSPWNDERIALVKRLCGDYSASQIAAEIWKQYNIAVTRNAVIGIMHRQGMNGRQHGLRVHLPTPRDGNGDTGGSQVLRARRARMKMRSRGHSAGVEEIDSVPLPEIDLLDAEIPVEQRKSLLELSADTCKWPVGDPLTPDFFFCGAAPISGQPYCACHSRRAYDASGNSASQMRWAASRATYYANR